MPEIVNTNEHFSVPGKIAGFTFLVLLLMCGVCLGSFVWVVLLSRFYKKDEFRTKFLCSIKIPMVLRMYDKVLCFAYGPRSEE